jgi:hypothetical protein
MGQTGKSDASLRTAFHWSDPSKVGYFFKRSKYCLRNFATLGATITWQ